MTGANMPTKSIYLKAKIILVGHRLITHPFYTVNVALVHVI
jgi:hypothetical protein